MSGFFDVSFYWDLPILIVIVSLVYGGTRCDRWDLILLEAWRWGARMAVFLGGIGMGLFVLSTFI